MKNRLMVILAFSVVISILFIPQIFVDALAIYVQPELGQNKIHLPIVFRKSAWVEVGNGSASGQGISNTVYDSSVLPSLAVSPEGVPYVAWEETTYDSKWSKIYVRRWDGNTWAEVGEGSATGWGISNTQASSKRPSLAISPDGTPYVAWEEVKGGDAIYIRRWNGSSWEEVGIGSASGGGISNNASSSNGPSLAIAPDGTPYVAWADNGNGEWEIYIRRWNGNIWEEVGTGSANGGGISNTPGLSGSPDLVIASNGTPYVTWADTSNGNYEIYVRHWNGSIWEEVGTGSASGGGISSNSGASDIPSIAVSEDQIAYVAWADESSGEGEIYIRYWDGNHWSEVGAGSASEGGISNTLFYEAAFLPVPSLAITSDGTPYVAWDNLFGADYKIYVRRWNGSIWEEAPTSSASGEGISKNADNSFYPSIATAPDGTPYIAWVDFSHFLYISEIYIRRFIE